VAAGAARGEAGSDASRHASGVAGAWHPGELQGDLELLAGREADRDAARWRDWLSSSESQYSSREFGLQKAQMLDPTARL
jgi:hypothetical protein